MSKYDNFINDLKNEVDNIKTPDISSYVLAKYQDQSINKKHRFRIKQIILPLISIILIIMTTFTIRVYKSVNPTSYVKVPKIATTIDESYAFEIMAAGNFIFTNSSSTTILSLNNKIDKEIELENITKRLNEHYLTIKQLLKNEKVEYEIIKSPNELYENQMIIKPFFNDMFDLKYTIYFNKILKSIDDDEELFDLDGIIMIDNTTYKIEGKTEIEKDEIETKIKVILSENEYFIIEQEKEDDEQEFVYSLFINNIKEKEYSISYELEEGDIEIEINIKESNNNEKLFAKIEHNDIILKVDFKDYKGRVKVIDNNTTVRYHFINENIIINKVIIKTKKNKNLPIKFAL